MAKALAFYVVYFNPRDFPGLYVMRASDVVDGELIQRSEVVTGKTLESVREHIPQGFVRMDRSPSDVLAIVETWC